MLRFYKMSWRKGLWVLMLWPDSVYLQVKLVRPEMILLHGPSPLPV